MTWLGYGTYWTQRFNRDLIPDKRIPHIGHKRHLCFMSESGEYSLDEIKLLVNDAKFICKKCGRVAIKAENLCEPKTL